MYYLTFTQIISAIFYSQNLMHSLQIEMLNMC